MQLLGRGHCERTVKSLPRPTRSHESLFDSCVAATTSDEARGLLLGIRAAVMNAGVTYAADAAGQLATVVPLVVSDSQASALKGLYSKQLVAGNERPFYDGVRRSAGRCPFCLFGEVYEVDHFLPRQAFPEFSVLPDNLVPICHPCNHKKRQKVPEGGGAFFLHPYFDVLPAIHWLNASIELVADGPAIRYSVELDVDIYGSIANRLQYQFMQLQLSERFAVSAAAILSEIEDILLRHLQNASPAEVAEYFRSEGERYYSVYGNCLEAAAFLAAASNEEYCSGSYRN